MSGVDTFDGDSPRIDLWVIDLDEWAELRLDPAAVTALDRRQAERLRDFQAGRRLLSRRAATRTILARSLGQEVCDLELFRRCAVCNSTDHGRPFIPGSAVSFSVSASGGLSALAVARHHVGVDLEIDTGSVPPELRALRQGEQSALLEMPLQCRGTGFLRLWTAKEATLKAAGRSLGDDPASVDAVSTLTHDIGVAVLGDRRWHVQQVSVEPRSQNDCVLAVVDGHCATIVLRSVEE